MKKFILLFTAILFFNGLAKAQVDFPELPDVIEIVRIDTSYTYAWSDFSENWEIYGRSLNFIDSSKLIQTVLVQHYDKDNGGWVNVEQTLKNYDGRGKMVQSILQSWDRGANDWVNVRMRTSIYDIRGKETEVLYQEWQRPMQEWINTVVYLIAYNLDQEKSEIVIRTYRGMEQTWDNYMRLTFDYPAGGTYPDEVLFETWNNSRGQWTQSGKYFLSHNFRGNVIRETRATWSESRQEWILGIRYMISYQRDDKTEDVEQRWDDTSGRWVNSIRNTYTYSEPGEIAEEIRYRWSRDINDWAVERRLMYSLSKPENITL